MSTTVKAGWLKDRQGNKFAPKTLTSQITRNDGTELDIFLDELASGSGGGIQPDWNQNDETAGDYVKNRTHYVASGGIKTLTFEKDLTGREYIERLDEERELFGYLVKITDDSPEPTAFYEGGGTIVQEGEEMVAQFSKEIIDEICIPLELNDASNTKGNGYMIGDLIVVLREDGIFTDVHTNETQVVSKGIWIPYSDSNPDKEIAEFYIKSISYGSQEVVVPLDEKYIPDSIMRLSDRTHWIEEGTEPTTLYITYDGVLDTEENFQWVNFSGDTITYIKISDEAPNSEQFVGNEIIAMINGAAQTVSITEDYIVDLQSRGVVASGSCYAVAGDLFVIQEPTIFTSDATVEFQKGVYVPDMSANNMYFASIGYTGYAKEVHQLDEIFIPDTIAREDDFEEITDEEILAAFGM